MKKLLFSICILFAFGLIGAGIGESGNVALDGIGDQHNLTLDGIGDGGSIALASGTEIGNPS